MVEIPVDLIDNIEGTRLEIARMVNDLSSSGAPHTTYESLTTAHAMLGDYAGILRLTTGKQASDFEKTADDFIPPSVFAVSAHDLSKPFSEPLLNVLDALLQSGQKVEQKVEEPYTFFRPAGAQSLVDGREAASQMFGLAYVGAQGPVGAADEGPAKSQKIEGVPEYIYQYKISANAEFKICSRREYERWGQQKGVTVRKLLAHYTMIEEKNNH